MDNLVSKSLDNFPNDSNYTRTDGKSHYKAGPPGSNIFVFHVPAMWSTSNLMAHFEVFGHIISGQIEFDDKGVSRGYAFISYSSPSHAIAAVAAMNGFRIHNKRLKVTLKTSDVKKRSKSKKSSSEKETKEIFSIVPFVGSNIANQMPNIPNNPGFPDEFHNSFIHKLDIQSYHEGAAESNIQNEINLHYQHNHLDDQLHLPTSSQPRQLTNDKFNNRNGINSMKKGLIGMPSHNVGFNNSQFNPTPVLENNHQNFHVIKNENGSGLNRSSFFNSSQQQQQQQHHQVPQTLGRIVNNSDAGCHPQFNRVDIPNNVSYSAVMSPTGMSFSFNPVNNSTLNNRNTSHNDVDRDLERNTSKLLSQLNPTFIQHPHVNYGNSVQMTNEYNQEFDYHQAQHRAQLNQNFPRNIALRSEVPSSSRIDRNDSLIVPSNCIEWVGSSNSTTAAATHTIKSLTHSSEMNKRSNGSHGRLATKQEDHPSLQVFNNRNNISSYGINHNINNNSNNQHYAYHRNTNNMTSDTSFKIHEHSFSVPHEFTSYQINNNNGSSNDKISNHIFNILGTDKVPLITRSNPNKNIYAHSNNSNSYISSSSSSSEHARTLTLNNINNNVNYTFGTIEANKLQFIDS